MPELALFRILDQRHAASRLDLSEAVGAIASGSRQHDADRPLPGNPPPWLEKNVVGWRWPRGSAGTERRSAPSRIFSVRRERSHGRGWALRPCRPQLPPPASPCGGRAAAPKRYRGSGPCRMITKAHPLSAGHRIEKAAYRFQTARRRTDPDDRDRGMLRVMRTLRHRPPRGSLHDPRGRAQPLRPCNRLGGRRGAGKASSFHVRKRTHSSPIWRSVVPSSGQCAKGCIAA